MSDDAVVGAFARRALTERAKGALMERHRIGEEDAFKMLRAEERRRLELLDVAQTVLDGYLLLPGPVREHGRSLGHRLMTRTVERAPSASEVGDA
jgi:hypothetical protein